MSDLLLDGSQARLTVVRKGEGRLYYNLAMDYLPSNFDKPAWEGFEVERVVKELGSQTPAAQPYKAGKKYAVTLTVRTRQDRTFVALTDALPGGFEVIDSSFGTESEHEARLLAQSQGAAGDGDWYTFNHAETYDDRVQVYGNFLKAGTHTWTYLVQATTPGVYSVPATWVEQMYEPEVFGRTASSQAEVR
jgi:alpha-2-macroglobulin